MTVSKTLQASMLVVAAGIIMSLGGAGIKLCSFGHWQLAGFRSLLAALVIFALAWEARRNWSWQSFAVGAALAGTYITFVWANKATTAASTIYIQFSSPLLILLLSPPVLGERIRAVDVVSMVFFAAGVSLFFASPERPTALSPEIIKGNWLALLSGFCYSLAVLGLRRMRGRGAEASLVCGNILTAAICLAVMLASGDGSPAGFRAGSLRDWLVVAFLGCFQIGISYIMFVRALRVLRAIQVTLISLLEPVLNPLWVFLLFRTERPGPTAVLGGAIIIATSAFQVVWASRASGRKRRES